jgi:type III restriction enzyme
LFGSDLITSTIADLNPSIIWELSATPFKNSNIIHRTSPIELKREDMIKLPIQIRHELSWEDVLEKSIKLQSMLEEKAKEEEKISGRYVRPIVIIRPEQIKDDENKITPTTIKEYIAKYHPELKTKDEVEKDDKFQIAEKYTLGDTDKTKGGATSSKKVDTLGSSTQLYKPESEVRYIIAYKAIREGWDCSFAYVYANLSNIRSETDAEQFIGRILRMPNAKRLNVPELNKAYVITKGNENSQSDMEVSIGNIVDILIKNGFSKEEAEHVAKPTSFGNSSVSSNVVGNIESSAIGQVESGEPNLDSNIGSKIDEYPYIATKQVNIDSFTLPKLYNDNKELREAHFLIGFNLDNLVLKTELSLINEKTGVIDFKENEKWQHSFLDQEQSIGLFGVSIEDLAEFIVRRSKDKYFDKPTEYKTIKKWLESITNTTVSELRRNLVTLSSYYLEEKVKQKDLYKMRQFEALVSSGKIKVINSFVINLSDEQEVYNPAGNYQKSIYTLIDNLNNLEKDYTHRLNNDPNVEWLYRNRERQDYFIQGWWGRFYPDFIYQTKDGILHIAETKGREDDIDKEKKKLGELLQALYPEVKFEWIKV